MQKSTFLDNIRSGHEQWENLLSQIPHHRMIEPGVENCWSIKDVIAHVMWGESEMIGFCQQHALAGSDLWDLPQDERNARVVEEKRNIPLDEILMESNQIYTQFLESVQQLTEEELNDPN